MTVPARAPTALLPPAATAQPSRERFIALEWLRFLLGFYIVIFHTAYHYAKSLPWIGYVVNLGFFSTSCFFVLSGFLLTHVYLQASPTGGYQMREPARSFLVKRLANLYPIHIGAILVTILALSLLAWMGLTPEDADHASMRFVIYDSNDGTPTEALFHMLGPGELTLAVVMNLLLLQAWNPYYLTFNAPAWSVSALLFFYLLFPYLAPKLRDAMHPKRAILGLNLLYLLAPLIAIAGHYYQMPETGILHRNPLVRLPEFLCGILLYVVYDQRRAACRGLTPALAVGGLLWIAANLVMAGYLLKLGHAWYYLLHDGLLLSAQLTLIYLCIFIPSPRSPRWQQIATRLGGASLPMFALHVPLYLLYSRLEMVLAGQPALCLQGQLRRCFQSAGQISLAWYPLYLLLTVAFCLVFQRQFVQRCRRALERLLLPAVHSGQPSDKPLDDSASARGSAGLS